MYLNCPLSMRERARVRGEWSQNTPHPAFGHLLPHGEGMAEDQW